MTIHQRATLQDVGRLAGVSPKTVSRVFNHRDQVAPETVEIVLAAAKRLRFRPNTLARGLRRGGTNTVGFMMGELGNPFYYKIAEGMERELAGHGYALIVATTDDTAEGEQRVADALLAQRIGALVLVPASPDQSHLEGERQLGTPIIAIDRPARNVVADSIVLDNRFGTEEATRRLLARGHRRIAYACSPASVYSQAERIAGYRAAMASAGVTDTSAWERLEDDRTVSLERIVGSLLDAPEPPTALICGNNRMTIGALRALRGRHDDHTALVGFDDFDTADVIGVTAITYDPVEVGRRAARLALARIADPSGFSQQITMPTWIVERGTGERPVPV
ncbi:LacI family DNA-binding transcriptional regulator [Microbacterium sorbitolivorans]|uniref:LacI family transcriptional regulator n=1 Tax=Microbacterium sorbitolivorans TaxID=1867410 RepID=A0A367Y2Y7_9MICO|nr:LacI family DNA-binding transcriptional regulator [Microbacterium sorbitolivorans]RCK60197.1 LacI family transcriptional regulator [Microbacterium sorbitolivorans]